MCVVIVDLERFCRGSSGRFCTAEEDIPATRALKHPHLGHPSQNASQVGVGVVSDAEQTGRTRVTVVVAFLARAPTRLFDHQERTPKASTGLGLGNEHKLDLDGQLRHDVGDSADFFVGLVFGDRIAPEKSNTRWQRLGRQAAK